MDSLPVYLQLQMENYFHNICLISQVNIHAYPSLIQRNQIDDERPAGLIQVENQFNLSKR